MSAGSTELTKLKRYVIVGGEAELLLLLHLFPDGLEELDGAFAVYADEPPIGFDVVRVEDVEDDWAERWREFHHGVQVGRFWIGPPWDLGTAACDTPSQTIVIDPGRAFGTGAHPTTRLTLELLQTLGTGSLLDIGCGSGVLSIGAAKLGFAPVHAVDVDEAAVAATTENARSNGVEVDARLLDGLVDELPAVDVALANVALDVVERLLQRVSAARVVTSGYLERDRPEAPGWTAVARATADGWAADVFERSLEEPAAVLPASSP